MQGEHHCILKWNENEQHSHVVLMAFSDGVTFHDGRVVEMTRPVTLHEGSEICFGETVPRLETPLDDLRYIFRHKTSGMLSSGLHAHYRLGAVIGQGAFGTVNQAICIRTNEQVAIKTIKPYGTKYEKLDREVTLMKQLRHPNICRILEYFYHDRDNGGINLVLELVKGGDLLGYIQDQNHILTESICHYFASQICDAMSYVHSKGVAHRDLKPENILLTDDNPPRVKVADFGLSKIVDPFAALISRCGTPQYMAPEVLNGKYGNLVDSWSVGVITFTMLTRADPFICDTELKTASAFIAERSVAWSVLEVHASVDAQNFVRCLLENDPSNRLSLCDALKHPWLTQMADDCSPKPSISDLNHDHERKPLRRRAIAVAEVNDNIEKLCQPSFEMIDVALSNSEDEVMETVDPKKRYRSPSPIKDLNHGMPNTPRRSERLRIQYNTFDTPLKHNEESEATPTKLRRSPRKHNHHS